MTKKDAMKKVCCICGKKFEGYGNNPYPVGRDVYTSKDRCCDDCNINIVVPARITELYSRQRG